MTGIISAKTAKAISKQGWEKRKCEFFKEHENELKEIVEQCNLAIIKKSERGGTQGRDKHSRSLTP